jgi:hypothetical protein
LWNGEKGLHNRFWGEWLTMLQNKRDVEMEVKLTTKELRAFSFKDKIRINNREYLARKLRVTLTKRGASVTKVSLVSV